ncbi:hypothetical protein FA13DRAFT_1724235 [Coprinellus micaceus]|uniref:Uncharacterized protein n=1 Tax=Coprinellus micaceus TaxID=71717 RepID=A0A4Y7U0Q1_COPMI|nr:hypothetical protein FA13DRAFT_1724235 [Coprinellus micaceus]
MGCVLKGFGNHLAWYEVQPRRVDQVSEKPLPRRINKPKKVDSSGNLLENSRTLAKAKKDPGTQKRQSLSGDNAQGRLVTAQVSSLTERRLRLTFSQNIPCRCTNPNRASG